MTLKEELEILRGEPIQVFSGDPMDIPCIETSDAEKLCQHPVVSVHMITYNHEPYIRQAIEGVMMQKTDFEFELVIGEDCSTDKTREICFEYQKRYPDKIRVLWCDHNLYRNPHPAGGNGQRTTAHCRGEFIAFCEGDDYWIDPQKLQKQVDVMRKHPNVGLCFCNARIYNTVDDTTHNWGEQIQDLEGGFMPSRKYLFLTMFGFSPWRALGPESWQMTATLMVRRSIYSLARRSYDIFNWQLHIGDVTLCLGTGTLSDVFYVSDIVSVYRKTPSGVTMSNGLRCGIDTTLVRYYFYKKHFNGNVADYPDGALCWLVPYAYFLHHKDRGRWSRYIRGVRGNAEASSLFQRRRWFVLRVCSMMRLKCSTIEYLDSIYTMFFYGMRVTPTFAQLYTECLSQVCMPTPRKSILKGGWHAVQHLCGLRINVLCP